MEIYTLWQFFIHSKEHITCKILGLSVSTLHELMTEEGYNYANLEAFLKVVTYLVKTYTSDSYAFTIDSNGEKNWR